MRLGILMVLLGCGRREIVTVPGGEACGDLGGRGEEELSSERLAWTSLGDGYYAEGEGVYVVRSEEEYAALWGADHGERPVTPDFTAEQLVYAKVFDRQSCFEPVLATNVGTTAGGTAVLLVYDDNQDCDSIRDFAALWRFPADVEVAVCAGMVPAG